MLMKHKEILEAIENLEKEKQVRFSKLLKICEQFFGNYCVSGSHHIFKTPWQGDPRIKLQKGKDKKRETLSSTAGSPRFAEIKGT